MMRICVGSAGCAGVQVSVEFPAWGEHGGVANEHFFPAHKAAGVHGDAAFGMVDIGDLNLSQHHIAGAHGARNFRDCPR